VEPAFDSWLGKGFLLFSKASERLRTPPSIPVNRYKGGFPSEVSGQNVTLATYRPESVLPYTSTATYVRSSVLHVVGILAVQSDTWWTLDRSKSKLTEGSVSVGRMVTFVLSDYVLNFNL